MRRFYPKCSAGSIDFKGQVHGSALHAYLSFIMYVSSMQAIRSCRNVVKEPICTLPWQSLALDQLKYLQIALN